jgi:hypothetical protein
MYLAGRFQRQLEKGWWRAYCWETKIARVRILFSGLDTTGNIFWLLASGFDARFSLQACVSSPRMEKGVLKSNSLFVDLFAWVSVVLHTITFQVLNSIYNYAYSLYTEYLRFFCDEI